MHKHRIFSLILVILLCAASVVFWRGADSVGVAYRAIHAGTGAQHARGLLGVDRLVVVLPCLWVCLAVGIAVNYRLSPPAAVTRVNALILILFVITFLTGLHGIATVFH